MSKAKDLRDQSIDELQALEREKRGELFDLKNKRARDKKNDNPASFRTMRRDIARILTVKREKELAN